MVVGGGLKEERYGGHVLCVEEEEATQANPGLISHSTD